MNRYVTSAVGGIIVAYVLFLIVVVIPDAMSVEVLPGEYTKQMPCSAGQAAKYSVETPPDVEPIVVTESGIVLDVERVTDDQGEPHVTKRGTWLWRTTVTTTESVTANWPIISCRCFEQEVPPSTTTTTTTTNGTATTTTTAGTTTTETTVPPSSTVPPSTASTTPPSTSTSVSTSTAPPTTGETSTLPPPSSSVPPTTPTETLVRTGPREDAIRLAGLGVGLLGLGSVLLAAVRRRYVT